jgi:exodeoxyribonuclease VII large subunit
VPVRLDLLGVVADFGARMTRAMGQRVETRGQRLRDLSRALPRPEDLLDGPRQRLDVMAERLPGALHRLVDRRRLTLSERTGSLRPSVLTRALAVEQARVTDRAARLAPALARLLAARREALGRRQDQLSLRPIRRELIAHADRLDGLARRLEDSELTRLNDQRSRLEALGRLHETLGYRETLRRGYAVVRGDGHVITTKSGAETATGLEIEFADGTLRLGGRSSTRKGAKTDPPEQGSLF